jgi:hypothetical protein
VSARPFRETLRRRIAPLVFLGLLLIFGSRTCASEMAEVELRLDLGDAATHVEALRVDVFPVGAAEGVASFERFFQDRHGPRQLGFEVPLDPGSYRLRIEARTPAGTRNLERTIVVGEALTEHTVISVDLEQALLPAPAGAD